MTDTAAPPVFDISKMVTTVENERPPRRWAFFGEQGSGKSKLAASANDVLHLDIDGTGRRTFVNHAELRSVHSIPIRTIAQLGAVWEAFANRQEWTKKYKTIILDTYSEAAKLKLDEQLASEDQVTEEGTRIKRVNEFLPSMLDYKENGERMRRMLIMFCDLDVDIIVVSHVAEKKGKNDGILYVQPDLADKVNATLSRRFDLVGFMWSEATEDGGWANHMAVRPMGRVKAKTRLKSLPNVIDMPTMELLYAADEADYQASAKGETPVTPLAPPVTPLQMDEGSYINGPPKEIAEQTGEEQEKPKEDTPTTENISDTASKVFTFS